MRFESESALQSYLKVHGKVASTHQVVLTDLQGGESPVPADQVQHYLDKGFRWPENPKPTKPDPVAEPKTFACPECGKSFKSSLSLRGHTMRMRHA